MEVYDRKIRSLPEVMLALECCGTDAYPEACHICPYAHSVDLTCLDDMCADALFWLKELRRDNERLRSHLKTARAERDAERARMTRLIGMAEKEWLEKVHPDWYERLSDLDYEYSPVKDGEPWYHVKDVWACIEEEAK